MCRHTESMNTWIVGTNNGPRDKTANNFFAKKSEHSTIGSCIREFKIPKSVMLMHGQKKLVGTRCPEAHNLIRKWAQKLAAIYSPPANVLSRSIPGKNQNK